MKLKPKISRNSFLNYILPLIGVVGLIIYYGSNSNELTDLYQYISPYITYTKEGVDYRIEIEIAQTGAEKSRGLMFRESLDSNSGMLFLYPDGKETSFWMKNMNFPLDLVYLDKDNKIQKIHKDIQPCTEDPCATYLSIMKTYGVLEVNAGYADEHNLQVGDLFNISY